MLKSDWPIRSKYVKISKSVLTDDEITRGTRFIATLESSVPLEVTEIHHQSTSTPGKNMTSNVRNFAVGSIGFFVTCSHNCGIVIFIRSAFFDG